MRAEVFLGPTKATIGTTIGAETFLDRPREARSCSTRSGGTVADRGRDFLLTGGFGLKKRSQYRFQED